MSREKVNGLPRIIASRRKEEERDHRAQEGRTTPLAVMRNTSERAHGFGGIEGEITDQGVER